MNPYMQISDQLVTLWGHFAGIFGSVCIFRWTDRCMFVLRDHLMRLDSSRMTLSVYKVSVNALMGV